MGVKECVKINLTTNDRNNIIEVRQVVTFVCLHEGTEIFFAHSQKIYPMIWLMLLLTATARLA